MKPYLVADLREQLKVDEGLRLRPYHCSAGYLTIGYGRNLDAVGLSEREAEYLLENDIIASLEQVKHRGLELEKYPPAIQVALANMAFNLGAAGLLRFQNMIAALDRGDYDKAAEEALNSRWAGQVGARAERIAEQIKEAEAEPAEPEFS